MPNLTTTIDQLPILETTFDRKLLKLCLIVIADSNLIRKPPELNFCMMFYNCMDSTRDKGEVPKDF